MLSAKRIERMRKKILGKDYFLSVAFVSPAKSRELNKKYRKKDKPTNVLSFALRKNAGEIILCPAVIKKEAKNFNRTFPQFMQFLVIHGMLHLKGYKHGKKMEQLEEKYSSRTKL
jgi:probable rRNA maturation factor